MLRNIKLRSKIILYKILDKLNLIKTVHYIGSGEILPPPLSPDEEAYYLSLIKEDETVKTILIERNLICSHIARNLKILKFPLKT